MNLDASRFLEDLTARRAAPYARAIRELLDATLLGDRPRARAAREELGDVIRETMAAAEVLGALSILREVQYASRGLPFAATQTVLPRVTMSEALEDMVERAPVTLKDAAQRTALRIAQLYSEGRVTAFARAAEDEVTEKAQEIIAKAIRDGVPEVDGARRLMRSVKDVTYNGAEWSESYARMVMRTNVNTAVTAGRFRQADDPDVRAVTPALRFDAVGDGDTRDNHQAADGLIMRSDNPEWRKIAPPLGYNCRCQVSLVSVPMLRRMNRIGPDGAVIEGRVPPDAHPDPGFRHGGRPDLLIAGSFS